MRPLQILINKYTVEKQDLEFKIESELNAPYPNIDRLDCLFNDITQLNKKNEYITQLLIDISNARNNNSSSNQLSE